MGLSGRKVKQRIPNDPRNLSWADDAARFGSNYLSKFGWDSSKGLGAGGDGMKSHIKVSHKLDMLGIGANHTKDPNGIAWKQNKDFENLLRRLNENMASEQAAAGEEKDDQKSESLKDDEATKDEKKKKRKHKKTEDDEDSEHIKKKKKQAKVEEDGQQTESLVAKSMEVVEEVIVEVQKKPIVPRHRAHRARAIAAKNISSKSAAHISEILGVAPNPAVVVEETTQGKLTSVMDADTLGVDKITTSTKSVADYFKDKLLARSSQSESVTPSSSNSNKDEDEAFGTPRMGLGASRFHMEVYSEVKVEEATQRMGLSKFSSLMSSSFLASASSFSSFVPPKVEDDEGTGHISEVESDSEPSKQKEKEKKKSKKRSKNVVEEQDLEQQDDKKKKKKDKKGKNKETLADEIAVEDEDGTERKKKKKSKKTKTVKFEEDAEEPQIAGDDTESRSHKNEKRKSKNEEVDDDGKKSRKDKKKYRSSGEEL